MYLSAIRRRRSLNSQKNNFDNSDDEGCKSCVAFRNYGQKYLETSTLHGLRYIGDKTLSNFERGSFVVSFILVFFVSIYFITNVWQKWSLAPIIIGLNPVSTQIKDIPFPAVTICNMNQAKRSVAQHIKEDTLEHIMLQSVCLRTETMNTTNVVGKWPKFQKFLRNITQPCSNLIHSCQYASQTIPCKKIFRSVLTDEGICCSFNSLAPKYMFQKYNESSPFENFDGIKSGKVFDEDNDDDEPIDWKPESGYPKGVPINSHTFPRPIAGTGSHMGLSVTLNANIKDYYCSSTNAAGFKILLHSPVETPKIAEFGFSVEPGLESRVQITPRISDASDLIRRVPKKIRQCLFANEDNLTYFRTYSKKNCEMECESQLTEQACSCVMYFMPRTNDETNICGRNDAKCYEEIKMAIDLSDNDTYACGNCLPGCSEINYHVTISTAQIGSGGYDIRNSNLSKMSPEDLRDNYALVHFFILESSFRSYTKGELIGFTEFLSNTGGLLGLFMGFSVISLIEIFYFMTFYPYCRHRNSNNYKNKSLNTVLIGSNLQFKDAQQGSIEKIKEATLTKMSNAADKIKNIRKLFVSNEIVHFKPETPPPPYPFCN